MNNAINDDRQPCGLIRRLVAIAYDILLLLAVLFAATALLMPFTHGHAISSSNLIYPLYLLAWSYLFFAWQWTHGGQTLGMRAWKLRLVSDDTPGGRISWQLATRRFLLALLSWTMLGAGFLWVLLDREKLAFHDHFSGSRLYHIKQISREQS